MSYEFRNPLHALLAKAAFDKVAKQMIQAFEHRVSLNAVGCVCVHDRLVHLPVQPPGVHQKCVLVHRNLELLVLSSRTRLATCMIGSYLLARVSYHVCDRLQLCMVRLKLTTKPSWMQHAQTPGCYISVPLYLRLFIQ